MVIKSKQMDAIFSHLVGMIPLCVEEQGVVSMCNWSEVSTVKSAISHLLPTEKAPWLALDTK